MGGVAFGQMHVGEGVSLPAAFASSVPAWAPPNRLEQNLQFQAGATAEQLAAIAQATSESAACTQAPGTLEQMVAAARAAPEFAICPPPPAPLAITAVEQVAAIAQTAPESASCMQAPTAAIAQTAPESASCMQVPTAAIAPPAPESASCLQEPAVLGTSFPVLNTENPAGKLQELLHSRQQQQQQQQQQQPMGVGGSWHEV